MSNTIRFCALIDQSMGYTDPLMILRVCLMNRSFPHMLLVVLLGVALAQCQQLTIQTEGGK